jgi:hypothetical protein
MKTTHLINLICIDVVILRHVQRLEMNSHNRILEKKKFKIEFDNHFHVFVLIQLIYRCRFTFFNIIHSENQHIKHQVNFVNLDFQRFKASFRVTLSSRFFDSLDFLIMKYVNNVINS